MLTGMKEMEGINEILRKTNTSLRFPFTQKIKRQSLSIPFIPVNLLK